MDDSTQKKNEYAWVAVEHKNQKGEPIIPESLIQSTWMTPYEKREKNSSPGLIIQTGYKPKPILMVSNKLYQVDKFSVSGWRRTVQMKLDIGPFRPHEERWFEEMHGMKAQVRDPGTPGIISEEYELIVTESDFERKINEIVDDKGKIQKYEGFEGTLIMRETLCSVLKREWVYYVRKVTTIVVTAIITATISIAATIWATNGGSEQESNTAGSPTKKPWNESQEDINTQGQESNKDLKDVRTLPKTTAESPLLQDEITEKRGHVPDSGS